MHNRTVFILAQACVLTLYGLTGPLLSGCYGQDLQSQMLAKVQHLRLELKPEAALIVVDDVIKRFPKSTTGYTVRYELHRDSGHITEALADINAAIALEPKNPRFIASRARLFDASGQLPQAISDYGKVLTLSPHDSGIYRERGKAHKRLKQYAAAAADFDQATVYGKNNRRLSDIMYDRAQMHLLCGDLEKALAAANELLTTFPDMSKGYWIRAQIYDKSGRAGLAGNDRSKATALDMSLDSGSGK